MFLWSIFPVKRVWFVECATLLSPVSSVPTCMKLWLWVMRKAVSYLQEVFSYHQCPEQKYCTGYAPEEYGGLTCVQVGNRMGREAREKAADCPAIVQYHQAVNAIDKRVERGTLERAIAARAKARAKELVAGAIADADYANGDYKNDMAPDALIAAVTKK